MFGLGFLVGALVGLPFVEEDKEKEEDEDEDES